MDILSYNDIHIPTNLKKQYERVVQALQQGDFKAADAKKMVGTQFYRAKLDDTNRLLFRFGQHEGKTYLFLLEIILNHDYDKSRFLNGRIFEEKQLTTLASEKQIPADDMLPIPYINGSNKRFHILDKIISFDDVQTDVFNIVAPVIIIGSAGSGKTALTLEKIKNLHGSILYITLSAYLVENSRNLYYSFGYDNGKQEIDFLSFHEYLETIAVPEGKEITFKNFDAWIQRYKQAFKIKDTYKLFEEFKGVLTGSLIDKAALSRDEYLNLGVRQSVYMLEERGGVYDLFEKYLEYLGEGRFYDSNLVSYQYLAHIQPCYDFIVVDEIQDFTNIQLYSILKSLHIATNFVLCGDSNQIVHPNFFSWSNIKTMFYKQDLKGDIIRILATNYRNTPEVTNIANQLLLVKNARFGSIDKESTYLVKPNSVHSGVVEFYEDKNSVKQDLDKRTSKSTKFAVLVMRNEDKAIARQYFKTPLLFSVQEAKGLEYENVILFNIISNNEAAFRELCNGVTPEDLLQDMVFSRAKDKTDKSLEVYKFYVNSLYVAITRAVKNLYVVESNKKHDLLALLGLTDFKAQISVKEQASTQDDWRREARKLEMQGKQEQADEIRRNILHIQPVPWHVITRENLPELFAQALNADHFNKKAKDTLFEYAILYNYAGLLKQLSDLKYRPADRFEQERKVFLAKYAAEYSADTPEKHLQPKIMKYGIDFRNSTNQTPLMMAISFGKINTIRYVLNAGANKTLMDSTGMNAFQMALNESLCTENYTKNVLLKIYTTLQNEYIKIRVNNKMIKISNHQMEYFLLNYMIATTHTLMILKDRTKQFPAYENSDFVRGITYYPNKIMPEYRKQRTYISSILSKNEVNRADKYNKQLFVRAKLGHYWVNPFLEIAIDDEWVNFYDLLGVNFDSQTLLFENSTTLILQQYKDIMKGIKTAIENKTKQQEIVQTRENTPKQIAAVKKKTTTTKKK